jgi:hypothetical protein
MYQTYRDRARFFIVYIAEAHALDEWHLESNERAGVCYRQPTTLEERLALARLVEGTLGLTIPTLVDGMDNAVNETFAGWPERIYIVGTDGRIVYQGGPGPYEFKPHEAAEVLERLLNG